MVSFLFYVSEDTAHEVINFNRKIPAGVSAGIFTNNDNNDNNDITL